MFSFLFFSFSRSYYISPELSRTLALKQMSYEEAANLSHNYSLLVGLTLAKDSSDLATEYSGFSTLYNGSIYFALIDGKSLRKQLATNTPRKSTLTFIKDGQIVDYVGNIREARHIGFLIEDYLNPKVKLLNTQRDLQNAIGKTRLTFFCCLRNLNIAKIAHQQILRTWGPTNLEILSDELAKGIGINPDDFAYYRIDDYVLDAIQIKAADVKKTDAQKADIVKSQLLRAAKNPTYTTFSLRDLKLLDKPIVTIIVDRPSEDQKKFLHELGSNFNDFEFGFLDNSARKHVNELLDTDKNPTFLAVFSLKHMYTYNLSSLSSMVPDPKFNASTWINPFAQLLMQIKNKKILPDYKSEKDDESSKKDYFRKIVGSNYDEYIQSDLDKDILMLYVRQNCRRCSQAFRDYKNFIEMVEQANVTTMKFGFIDVSRNGVKDGFPTRFADPHFVIFPKGRKAHSKPIPVLGIKEFTDMFTAVPIFSTNLTAFGEARPFSDDKMAEIEETLNYSYTKIPYYQQEPARHAWKILTNLKKQADEKKNAQTDSTQK